MPRSSKHPLARYVAAVAVTWAIVLAIAWLVGGSARLHVYLDVCGGFFIGMLAMYLAVRVYAPGLGNR
jgi:hypothetical protein